MNQKIKELIDRYADTEEELMQELSKLPNEGMACDCDDCQTVKFVHEGNLFDEVITTCLNCGGYVDNENS